ncbi:transposase [Kluyvera cryocrescens]|uniref:transposase n=1 Tax=Kluyvera cryocrescens TaxID=580 RepID=UPI0039F67AE2
MGFWETAGKLAKNVAQDALDSTREMKAVHDRLEGQNSTALKKIVANDGYFSSGTEMEKRLARKILRDRGES